MMKKLIQAAAIIALLTGTASAQLPMPSFPLNGDGRQLTPEEMQKQKAIDQAYRSATKKIPNKKAANDPWGNIRSAPTSQGQQ